MENRQRRRGGGGQLLWPGTQVFLFLLLLGFFPCQAPGSKILDLPFDTKGYIYIYIRVELADDYDWPKCRRPKHNVSLLHDVQASSGLDVPTETAALNAASFYLSERMYVDFCSVHTVVGRLQLPSIPLYRMPCCVVFGHEVYSSRAKAASQESLRECLERFERRQNSDGRKETVCTKRIKSALRTKHESDGGYVNV